MTLPRYQELKDSGIDYLGAVPNTWSLKRLGDIVAFAQGKAHEPYIDDDGDYICVNSRFVSTAGKTFKNCAVNLTPASLNDILMVMSDLPNGRALARAYYVRDNGKYAVNQRVCRITAKKADSSFLFYLLDRHSGLMQNDDGVHQTHLSNDDFLKLKLHLPSLSEQSQIARFLDHETARIDALIAEQQRLIELLKEKRQAVISHAVTKGLDPMVPMKDSGVEWLGEVPAHWSVHQLKRAIAMIESGTSVNAADYPAETGSFGVLKTSCVYTGTFDWRENKTVDQEDLSRVSCPLIENTLIVSRMNTPDLVGATGLVSEAPEGIFLPDRLWQVYIEQDHFPSFIFYFTKSPEYREQVKVACSGTSSSMQNLGQDDFRSLLFVQPPLLEQIEIASFLDGETRKLDLLIEEAAAGVVLLNERRSALISAAVTGKIDVRGWQPPANTQAPESAVAEAN
ncbi:restriction endonuclease subunit S [Stutzerimonas nitrititolerans]|uniref:restriction endonuclease subunit S n=1 Tax=Stutzerimonas nitrititolerans TaxID=2482751 RepID=UPI002896FC23|nr:restriction endonuclease subunit S [Stutzerimonas nitrititolerans]